MNRKAKTIVVAALLSGLPVGADAQKSDMQSANYMHQHCRNWLHGNTSMMPAICAGMVSAAMGYANLLKPEYAFCPPKTSTNLQGIEVVVRFLDEHPEVKHEDFQVLVLFALRNAWRCR